MKRWTKVLWALLVAIVAGFLAHLLKGTKISTRWVSARLTKARDAAEDFEAAADAQPAEDAATDEDIKAEVEAAEGDALEEHTAAMDGESPWGVW